MLRADIHSLFDKALLTIRPRRLPCRLVGEAAEYLLLELGTGKIVNPAPVKPYLEAQFRFLQENAGAEANDSAGKAMTSRTKMECENLNPQLFEEVQRVLPALFSGRP
ncbi:hypothetical protein F2981_21795 (plasmid) [Sinorhizobium meliloti]|nr:hypothetical protein [Sinorhizobium meliloti]